MKNVILVFVLATFCASTAAFVPSSGGIPAGIWARARVAPICYMSAKDDENEDLMLKLSLNQMESIKGREGLQGKDADKAISSVKLATGGKTAEEERTLLRSRRLAKLFGMKKDEEREKIAFDTMFNSLQSMFGRDGFKGKDAEDALKEIAQVNTMVSEEEDKDKKMLGSKRVYKFVRAATKTLTRPIRRRNHPNEVYDSRAGHR